MTHSVKLFLMIASAAIWLSAVTASANGVRVFDVEPQAESEPAQSLEDAADDAEIWLNAEAPEKSVIFGTDKKSGLFTYDIEGKRLDFFPVGRINNVDLRPDFKTEAGTRVIIGASNRTKLGVSLFTLDPATGKVTLETASFISTDLADPYGFCMYRDAESDTLFAIVIGKDGEFRQYAVTSEDEGIKGTLVRKFSFGSIAEGCVADDRTGVLYVADEMRGIWKLGAKPDSGDNREIIARLDGKDLVADMEGLTLAPEGKDGGFLIASVQGNNSYALFSLPETKLVARFRIVASADNRIDDVTGTDGIALRLGNFGPKYPTGMFVAQDDVNPGSAQNFKFVSWSDILSKLNETN